MGPSLLSYTSMCPGEVSPKENIEKSPKPASCQWGGVRSPLCLWFRAWRHAEVTLIQLSPILKQFP